MLMFNSSSRVAADKEARHPFERVGFGKGPYRFVGQEEAIFRSVPGAPAQPGTCCDYCGTGIMGVFWFQSSEKVLFKVGCDCLKKAAKEGHDYPLQTIAAKMGREHDRKIRHAREAVKIAELKQVIESEAMRLETIPHPYKYHAEKGKTLGDYCAWTIQNAGNAGKCELLKYLEKVAVNGWRLPVIETIAA